MAEVAGGTRADLHALAVALDGVDHALIVPHTNPDPDAIASAVALRYLLTERFGISSDIRYQGVIGRAENRALVHYLHRPLRRLRPAELAAATAIFVMDTQLGAGNCPVPISAPVCGVVDHHPQRENSIPTTFFDVRPNLGATATILTEYLQQAELNVPQWLATALFYGIKTDTSGLLRGATTADVTAFLYLQPLIDTAVLLEIEQAQVPLAYFRQLYAAVQTAQIYQDVVIADLGSMAYPDIAGEVADLLLRLEGMQWSVCIGVYDDVLVLSVRTRRKRGGAGRLVGDVVGSDGSAGGHGMAAGGQIMLDAVPASAMTQTMIQRVLMYLQQSPDAGIPLVP